MTGVDITQIIISLLVGVAAGIISGLILRWRNTSMKAVIAVAAILFILCAAVTAYSYEAALTEIPPIIGLSKDEAELKSQKNKLSPIFTQRFSDTVDKGRVISQDLSPGLLVKKGSEVHFVVSKGPSPVRIIDEMNSTSGWKTHREDNKSSINITSILGRTGNAIEISYDLKEKGCVSIYKEINPEILFGKEGIIFFYNASGGPNTLTIGLEYEDTTQFISSYRATVTDKWVPVKVPFLQFKRWNDEEYKAYEGELVDLKKVCKIVFIILNCPEQGDVYGSGWVIIDDVQAITS